MYQAIVFLPLLGFILAPCIALAGARARHPGADPSSAAEGEHGAAAAVAHSDPHHGSPDQAEPPAAGSRTAELITTTFLIISGILSWIAFVDVGFGHHEARVLLFPWFESGELKVTWALRIDTLSAVMLVVVTTVSALVHVYSIGYMAEDPHRPRFFAYLSLFTFAMLMLVTADNLA